MIIGVAGVAIAIGVTPALLTADTSNLFVGSLAIVLATVSRVCIRWCLGKIEII